MKIPEKQRSIISVVDLPTIITGWCDNFQTGPGNFCVGKSERPGTGVEDGSIGELGCGRGGPGVGAHNKCSSLLLPSELTVLCDFNLPAM